MYKQISKDFSWKLAGSETDDSSSRANKTIAKSFKINKCRGRDKLGFGD